LINKEKKERNGNENLDAVKQIERGMNLNGNIMKRRGKFVVIWKQNNRFRQKE